MSFFSILDKATLENLAADPTSVSGRMYLNTSTGAKWYDGAAWRVAATLDSTQTFTNKTLDASKVSTYLDYTEVSAPANPSAGTQRMYVKSDGKVYKRNSAGTEVEIGAGAGSDSSFRIDSVATPNVVIKGGIYGLDDGRTLITYDGATYGADLTKSLTTLYGSAPADATAYAIYVDIDALSAGVLITAGTYKGLTAVAVQTDAHFKVFLETAAVNLARYVKVGWVRSADSGTAWSGTGATFGTYAQRKHDNGPLAINPKVYTLSQAVGSVGSASQIKAGHILAAESFPSDMGATLFSLYGLAGLTDGSGNSRALTAGGSGSGFTATGILADANAALSTAGTGWLQSGAVSFFNPGPTASWGIGGWFKPAAAWNAGVKYLMGNENAFGDFGFAILQRNTNAIEFRATANGSAYTIDLEFPHNWDNASWHHIAMVYNYALQTAYFYMDGKVVGSAALSGQRTITTNNFRLGTSGDNSLIFNGSIDEAFFVNGYALKDSDIRKLYASKLTHGANVSAANQDWKFLLGSGVQKVPSISPVVDQTSSNTLYADFSDLDAAETVDIALLDMGMTAVSVPAVPPFDQTYTSNPSFPISHGLSEVPVLQVGYKDSTGDWHWATGEGAVKADSTQLKGSIQTYFDAAATHVRIRAVVGASPTGVKEATASAAGIVSTGTQTFGGIKNNASNPAFRVDKNGAATVNFMSGDSPLKITGWSEASATAFDQGGNFASDKFTVPAGAAGIYHFGCHVTFSGAALAADSCTVYIYKNGSAVAIATRIVTTAGDHVQKCDVTLNLAAADYIEFYVGTSSGTNIGYEGSAAYTFAYGFKVS